MIRTRMIRCTKYQVRSMLCACHPSLEVWAVGRTVFKCQDNKKKQVARGKLRFGVFTHWEGNACACCVGSTYMARIVDPRTTRTRRKCKSSCDGNGEQRRWKTSRTITESTRPSCSRRYPRHDAATAVGFHVSYSYIYVRCCPCSSRLQSQQTKWYVPLRIRVYR